MVTVNPIKLSRSKCVNLSNDFMTIFRFCLILLGKSRIKKCKGFQPINRAMIDLNIKRWDPIHHSGKRGQNKSPGPVSRELGFEGEGEGVRGSTTAYF
jgi:hypothetical protein